MYCDTPYTNHTSKVQQPSSYAPHCANRASRFMVPQAGMLPAIGPALRPAIHSIQIRLLKIVLQNKRPLNETLQSTLAETHAV